MFADSHCHTLDPKLSDRAEYIVNNLQGDGLSFVVEASASPAESLESVAYALQNENVYCLIGVHPICADLYSDEFETWAAELFDLANPKCRLHRRKVVAVGEVGLDYYHMDQPEDVQKDVFVRQIVLADKLGLPLVVHTRDAFADTIEILMENRGKLRNGLLIHCFSEGTEEVEKLRELDAYFAFGGAITYKNNLKSADAIKAAPRDRLLLETDCPYLAPVPLRGIVNEPKNVRIVAEYMARILNLTTEEVGDMTLENTKRFYRIK